MMNNAGITQRNVKRFGQKLLQPQQNWKSKTENVNKKTENKANDPLMRLCIDISTVRVQI